MLKELLYPFDAGYILSKKKRIRKQLLEHTEGYIEKRIAILGGFTTSDIRLILELFLLNQGIRPSFYESEYNQYYQDAVFPNPELEAFQPDIIYICTSSRNITRYPAVRDDAREIDQMLLQEKEKFYTIWDSLCDTYKCPVIQNNFEMPLYRLLGNKDVSDIHGRTNFLARLNMEFYAYAQQHDNFYICDINYLSADYGLREWSDPFYYHMYKYAVNVNAIPYLAFQVSNIIKSVFGKNKKGFVLDLDDTLWGGVIGENGADNIVLGPEEPEGQVYLEFQRYLKEHQQIGVILNIDSKNDYENAVSGIRHPDSALSLEDFIEIKANWEAKDKNFEQIAQNLSLLPESLVFIDDNPAERHIVTGRFPDVCAPEIAREAAWNYIPLIDRSGFFEVTELSKEDLKRNEMYRNNAGRAQMQAAFSDYREYLLSLEMKGIIRPFEPVCMARIAQLTNKSNQFNLTTRRYTQAEIEAAARDKDAVTLYGRLSDRFGDNGIVSVIIGRIADEECRIDLWIMSCRVLKRDMEYAMMDALVKKCRQRGIRRIHGYYYPTVKNGMVRDFYALQGFSKIAEHAGNTEWMFDITDSYENKNTVIRVEE